MTQEREIIECKLAFRPEHLVMLRALADIFQSPLSGVILYLTVRGLASYLTRHGMPHVASMLPEEP